MSGIAVTTPSLRVMQAITTGEGDGAEVRRLFPIRAGRMNFDPFVLWDNFLLEPGTGFPTHPHRGFEAITYLFGGAMQHKDNLGNESTVLPGGAQRFTAGSGIRHSEMPTSEGATTGIQLWINLPKRLKQVEPAYQQVNANDIPELMRGKARLRVIVGEGSPLQLLTPVHYLDIQLPGGEHFDEDIHAGFRGLIFVVSGQVQCDEQILNSGDAMLVEGLERLAFYALHDSRVMWCMGMPHGEPISQYGPYVD